jgi:hypothetical protein
MNLTKTELLAILKGERGIMKKIKSILLLTFIWAYKDCFYFNDALNFINSLPENIRESAYIIPLNSARSGWQNGYYTVGLQINKKKKMFFVHRLVAEYFIAPKKDNLQVNHIDGNKANNDFRNLEWVTPSQNTKHAYNNGLNKNVIKGIKKANSKKVCDTSTNIVYDSAKDAAICKRINYGTLRNKLNGHDNNNTTLKYV